MADERPLTILGIGPGRSINFVRWARILSERGHDVHIVSDVITETESLDGVTAHNVRDLGPLMRVKGLRRLGFARVIRRLGEELGADVVHAHYLLPYGYWGAKAGLHPYVVSPWSRDIFFGGPETKRRGPRWAREAIAASDYLVTNSRANERRSAELGADPDRMEQIIWYAEMERFSPANADPAFRARLGWPEDAIVVLSLRYFRPYTNVDVVVRAFARVAKEEPRARLFLASPDGPTRREVEALVDELGIRDLVHVQRLGWDDLPAVVASSDLAVSIADTDSTPASLLETMASGVPVVAGAAPSMDEWVSQGEGAEFVEERRNVDAVAAAIGRLVADPELRRRYGERNERVVRERFPDPPAVALEAIYRRLLAE